MTKVAFVLCVCILVAFALIYNIIIIDLDIIIMVYSNIMHLSRTQRFETFYVLRCINSNIIYYYYYYMNTIETDFFVTTN